MSPPWTRIPSNPDQISICERLSTSCTRHKLDKRKSSRGGADVDEMPEERRASTRLEDGGCG